jgi:DNA-binding transcriptional LysR family regulator
MIWVMRSDHPLAGEPLTLDRLATSPHIVLSMAEDGHVVDGAVADSGLERRVIWDDGGVIRRLCQERGVQPPPTYTAPDVHSALSLLPGTDLVALAPQRFARVYAKRFGLALFEPPYSVRPFDVVILWRKKHDAAALAWLRGLISDAAKALGPADRRPAAARSSERTQTYG